MANRMDSPKRSPEVSQEFDLGKQANFGKVRPWSCWGSASYDQVTFFCSGGGGTSFSWSECLRIDIDCLGLGDLFQPVSQTVILVMEQ